MSYFAKNVHGMEYFKIIDSLWFNVNTFQYLNKGEIKVIGIIKAKDTITKEYKCYIGVGKGENIKDDETLILATGTYFSPKEFDDIKTVNKLRESK